MSVGRSEKSGEGASRNVGAQSAPPPSPVEIGLIYLPRTGEACARPPPPGSDSPDQYMAGAEEARNFKLHEIQMAT